MPKLKKTPLERMDDEFRASLAYGLVITEMNRETFAEKMDVDPATVSGWKNNPEKISIRYLRKMVLLGVLTPGDVTRIIVGGDGKP